MQEIWLKCGEAIKNMEVICEFTYLHKINQQDIPTEFHWKWPSDLYQEQQKKGNSPDDWACKGQA